MINEYYIIFYIKVYYRNCSSGIWLPPTGKYDVSIHGSTWNDGDCVKDKYSGELFCYCFGNLCNSWNVGTMSVYSKCFDMRFRNYFNNNI